MSGHVVTGWLTEIAVQLDMLLSNRTHDQAVAVVQNRRHHAKIARAARRQQSAIAHQQKQAERAVQRSAREVARQQEKFVREQRAQAIAAYEQQCKDESMYRRIALDAARSEAVIFVANLGFSPEWVNAPWFDTGRQERLKYQAQLVEKYTAQILGNNASPLDQMIRQRRLDDPGFANSVGVKSASTRNAKSYADGITFED